MKKLLLLLTIAFLLPVSIFAQNYVEIGTGDTQALLPAYTSWNYSWFSGIYNSEDLGEAKTIQKLAFNAVIENFTYELTNQKIYLKHSSDAAFANGSTNFNFPYEDPENNGYTLVYEGSINYEAGWLEIDITDFEYNGTDNLVLHWENEFGTANYSVKFACTETTENIVKCWGNDDALPVVDGYAPYPKAFPNMRVIYPSSGPATPTLVAPVHNSFFNSLDSDLEFNLDPTIETYDIYIGTDQDNLTALVENQTATEVVNYELDRLDAMTTYYWNVVAKIGTEETTSPMGVFTTEEFITEFPYEIGFESEEFPPAGWEAIGSAWIHFGGELEPSSPHTGNYCAKAHTVGNSEYAYLTMPKIAVGDNDRISFWWMDANFRQDRITGVDSTFFEISTDEGMTWEILGTYSADSAMTEYTNEFISLTPYANQEVMMRWRDKSPLQYEPAARGFLLDDVVIENQPTESVLTIETPSLAYSNLVIGGTQELVFEVTNTGAVANITSVTIDAPFSCDFVGTIDPEETIEIPVSYTPTTVGTHSATATLNLSNDVTGETTIDVSGSCIDFTETIFSSFDGIDEFPENWNTITETINQYSDVWIQSASYDAHSGTQFVKMYNAVEDSVDAELLLVLPGVADVQTNPLNFWSKCTDGAVGAKLQVGTMSNPYDANTFVLFEELDVTGTYAEFSLELTATTNNYIAFRHGLGGESGHALYIDDISWQATTEVPGNAIIVNPTEEEENVKIDYTTGKLTRDLEWAVGTGSPTGYYLTVGLSNGGNELVDNLELTAASTSYNLDYEFQYGDEVFWKVTPFNVNGPALAPETWHFSIMEDPTFVVDEDNTYTEGFESAEVGFSPAEWTIVDSNEDNNFWSAIGNSASYQNTHTGDRALHMMFSFSAQHDDWAFTAPLQLEAGNTYQIKYWVKIATIQGSFEKYRVGIGTSPSAEGITETLISNNNTTNTDYEQIILEYTPENSGNYFVGFHCESDPVQFILLIDDVEVSLDEVSSDNIAPVQNKLVGNYPNPFNPKTSISFQIAEDSNVAISIYNSRGQFVKTVAKGNFTSGSHNVLWDGTDESSNGVASGVYFYRMSLNGKATSIKKCLLLK